LNGAAAVDVKGFERENWTPISLFRLLGEESWETIPPDASGITRRPHRSCVSPLLYQPVVCLFLVRHRDDGRRGVATTTHRTELNCEYRTVVSQSVCRSDGAGQGFFQGGGTHTRINWGIITQLGIVCLYVSLSIHVEC